MFVRPLRNFTIDCLIIIIYIKKFMSDVCYLNNKVSLYYSHTRLKCKRIMNYFTQLFSKLIIKYSYSIYSIKTQHKFFQDNVLYLFKNKIGIPYTNIKIWSSLYLLSPRVNAYYILNTNGDITCVVCFMNLQI